MEIKTPVFTVLKTAEYNEKLDMDFNVLHLQIRHKAEHGTLTLNRIELRAFHMLDDALSVNQLSRVLLALLDTRVEIVEDA